jgi:Domain of unknown function (DUF222)
VLAHGTAELAAHRAAAAEPVLLEAAGRLDPPRLRQVLGHLQQVIDPEAADRRADQRYGQRGLWLSPTIEGMVAVGGLLDPEAGQTLQAALEPLARPATAQDHRSGSQRQADALTELARRQLEAGQLPQSGGVRPQLLVTVDLDSLVGHPGAVGGEAGWTGPLEPEACRRLACDGAVTRVVVTRHPTTHDPITATTTTSARALAPAPVMAPVAPVTPTALGGDGGLAALLRAAATRLPPALGGPRPSRWRWAGPAGS